MKNYNILVLSDMKSTTKNLVKSTIGLAKMIDGKVDFFHVKKPTDVVEKENQLSAMRAINDDYTSTRKKVQKLLDSVSEEYDTDISFNFSFGNVKDEIVKYIQETKPDIIVLGKRKATPFNFIGDNITQLVLQKHEGVIMIASPKNILDPNKELSLGILNGTEGLFNIEFAENLIYSTQKPLKSFKFTNSYNTSKETNTKIKTIEYVFEQNDQSIRSLSNYVSKNNINLLCVNRSNEKTGNHTDIKDVIHKVNVSLLVAGEQDYAIQ